MPALFRLQEVWFAYLGRFHLFGFALLWSGQPPVRCATSSKFRISQVNFFTIKQS
jgi:hypothetical protein